MRNKGLHTHRFKDNPLEKRFAKQWDLINSSTSNSTLDYMLAENNNNPNGEVSKRDIVVAATVIQWLGSHVGQSFLSDVLGIDIRSLIKREWRR